MGFYRNQYRRCRCSLVVYERNWKNIKKPVLVCRREEAKGKSYEMISEELLLHHVPATYKV